jgi:hypothetical protein
MNRKTLFRDGRRTNRVGCAVLASGLFLAATTEVAAVGECACGKWWPHLRCAQHAQRYVVGPGDIRDADFGGSWYWMRSPEQERRVVMSLYNRYCVRCHGIDGRGVWDIPCVPDFTDVTWQASRPDPYRTRVILEGRGAVMPAFRGTLTLEEACAMARYLHTLVPGTEVSRPDVRSTPARTAGSPAPASAPAPLPPPAPVSGSPFTR